MRTSTLWAGANVGNASAVLGISGPPGVRQAGPLRGEDYLKSAPRHRRGDYRESRLREAGGDLHGRGGGKVTASWGSFHRHGGVSGATMGIHLPPVLRRHARSELVNWAYDTMQKSDAGVRRVTPFPLTGRPSGAPEILRKQSRGHGRDRQGEPGGVRGFGAPGRGWRRRPARGQAASEAQGAASRTTGRPADARIATVAKSA
jgi:hypothetical protein